MYVNLVVCFDYPWLFKFFFVCILVSLVVCCVAGRCPICWLCYVCELFVCLVVFCVCVVTLNEIV